MESQIQDSEHQNELQENDGCPAPPKLHWALVFFFTLITFGLFGAVWSFVQSSWIKKIDPDSNATVYFIIQLTLVVFSISMDISPGSGVQAASSLVMLLSIVMYYCACYSMQDSMVRYFNNYEYTGLEMSAGMTFFFSQLYIQYHMTRIAKWKLAGKPSNE